MIADRFSEKCFQWGNATFNARGGIPHTIDHPADVCVSDVHHRLNQQIGHGCQMVPVSECAIRRERRAAGYIHFSKFAERHAFEYGIDVAGFSTLASSFSLSDIGCRQGSKSIAAFRCLLPGSILRSIR